MVQVNFKFNHRFKIFDVIMHTGEVNVMDVLFDLVVKCRISSQNYLSTKVDISW